MDTSKKTRWLFLCFKRHLYCQAGVLQPLPTFIAQTHFERLASTIALLHGFSVYPYLSAIWYNLCLQKQLYFVYMCSQSHDMSEHHSIWFRLDVSSERVTQRHSRIDDDAHACKLSITPSRFTSCINYLICKDFEYLVFISIPRSTPLWNFFYYF